MDKGTQRRRGIIVLGLANKRAASFIARRFTSLPRSRADRFAIAIHHTRFRLGIIPGGLRADADIIAPARPKTWARLGENFASGADRNFQILHHSPSAIRHPSAWRPSGSGTTLRMSVPIRAASSADRLRPAGHALARSRSPLHRRNGKGDTSRLDALQVHRRQSLTLGLPPFDRRFKSKIIDIA